MHRATEIKYKLILLGFLDCSNYYIESLMNKILYILTLFLSCTQYLQAQSDPEILEFAVINDTHGYGKTADRRDASSNVAAFVDYCNTHTELQFALYGGDFYNSYSTNHETGLELLRTARADFQGLKLPFYTTRGNHDTNGKCRHADRTPDNSQIVTDAEYYELFSPLSKSNPLYCPEGVVTDDTKPYGNYYYRDFPTHRTRIIVLNNYDQDSLEYDGYHDHQLRWVAEQALNLEDKADAEEWCFLLLAHRYFVSLTGKPLSRVLHAYVNGQDISETDGGITYSAPFSTMRRGRIAAFLGGHYHEDDYQNTDGYNIITLNRGFATDDEQGDDAICFHHFRLDTRRHTLEMQRIGRGRSCLFSFEEAQRLVPVPAFPEASGLGFLTTGGTCGRHLTVTSLDDDGPGTLRWAVGQQGARVIDFALGGTIQLQSPLLITNDSISILGPAEGPGIIIEGAPVRILASEVVMRYLTTRDGIYDADTIGQHYLLLDHLTCMGGTTSAMSIRHTQESTIQYCRFLSDNNSVPALVGGGTSCTYYSCLFDGCPQACYLPGAEGTCRDVQIDHCVFSRWHDHAIYGGGNSSRVTIMKSYFVPGPETTHRMFLDTSADGTGRYYIKMNVMMGEEKNVAKNDIYVNDENRRNGGPSSLVVTAFRNQPYFDFRTPEELAAELLSKAGSGYRPL